MSGCARFILVNYKQDLLGKNTADNIGIFVLKGNLVICQMVNVECSSFVTLSFVSMSKLKSDSL